MAKRKIVKIDTDKCNGCGECIPNCKEGALKIIDGKARLVSDLFCDGLGACIGHCPKGAISIIEREARPYDEIKVMKEIIKQGKNTIIAHLNHLKEHNERELLRKAIGLLRKKKISVDFDINEKQQDKLLCGCPGTMARMLPDTCETKASNKEQHSMLRQWPVQMQLLNPSAPYFHGADIAIIADCVGFANPNLQNELIKGRTIAIGRPKLDDIDSYKEKIRSIIEIGKPKSITVAIMEVPCCNGLYEAALFALSSAKSKMKIKKVIIGVDGKVKE